MRICTFTCVYTHTIYLLLFFDIQIVKDEIFKFIAEGRGKIAEE